MYVSYLTLTHRSWVVGRSVSFKLQPRCDNLCSRAKTLERFLLQRSFQGGIIWPYEGIDSLVFRRSNVYNGKKFNSSYDHAV